MYDNHNPNNNRNRVELIFIAIVLIFFIGAALILKFMPQLLLR